jgi:Carboxypeptidase regulatory-like domain
MKRAKILPAFFLCGVIAITIVTQFSTSLAVQPSKRKGVITGRVVTGDGQPASEATVIAYAIGSSEAKGLDAECDDDGNFKLTELKPGSYIIFAFLPGYISLNDTSEIHRIGENVTLTLAPGGVITGRVTDADGEPMEGARVDLRMARGAEGRISAIPRYSEGLGSTDDRGVYRIYGLLPGKYLVRVMDTLTPEYHSSGFRRGAPTYYPSTNRAAAAEITVRAGEEVTGIDISYLGQWEHSISGLISGEVDSESTLSMVNVFLRDEASGEVLGSTGADRSRNFSLYGVTDGTYEIVAQGLELQSSDTAISAPRRVTVKGSDITGVNLKLLKPASISGRLAIEAPKSGGACGRPEKFSVEEIALQIVKTDARDRMKDNPLSSDRDKEGHFTAPDEKGQFAQKNLEEGVYRIIPGLPDYNWRLRSVTRTSKGAPRKVSNIVRDGISLTAGENLTGVEMIVGTDAVMLRGRIGAANVTQAREGAFASPRWRVHIIPAEETAAEDLLRYAETTTRSDGSFEMKHLAPGKYFLLAREILAREWIEDQPKVVAWDHLERAKLRREAQALKQEIALRPCQQINDYALRIAVKLK